MVKRIFIVLIIVAIAAGIIISFFNNYACSKRIYQIEEIFRKEYGDAGKPSGWHLEESIEFKNKIEDEVEESIDNTRLIYFQRQLLIAGVTATLVLALWISYFVIRPKKKE